MSLLSRLFARLPFSSARPAAGGHASDAETTDPKRNLGKLSDDTKTIRISRSPSGRLSWPARDGDAPPEPRSSRAQAPVDSDEAPTRLVSDDDLAQVDTRAPRKSASKRTSKADSSPPPRRAEDDDMTRLVTAEAGGGDPAVGWLVVVEGPGRGRSVEIGSGSNSIGRAPGQKLCLNFGDKRISRERHAALIYDPLSARFFLHNGDVRNLTYVGQEVVLSPVEIKGGETITLGDTKLRFVPFCGPHFGWK